VPAQTHAEAVAAVAREAHAIGDVAKATALFRAILKYYPVSPEATDALTYLGNQLRGRTNSGFESRT
jgi:TolA-binding protein